eukprot:SAG22_NODE_33_length_27588_cov_104.174652_20_plen_63_part_00
MPHNSRLSVLAGGLVAGSRAVHLSGASVSADPHSSPRSAGSASSSSSRLPSKSRGCCNKCPM